ncbi:MAG: hypothetical protein HDS64_11860 [Bacteroidales bacterium]|nr:hypothetical protein [Bacteroidales bacterium]
MNQVTTTAAPQAYLSDGLYEKWMEAHTGTKEDFLRFLTLPSAERVLFLGSLRSEIYIAEGIGTVTYSA